MSLKKLPPFAEVTAKNYNALVEEIKRLSILPGFGIQLQKTSAGTSLSIDHGGVATVVSNAGSANAGLPITSVFPAYLAASSTAVLLEAGRYKYSFYTVSAGLDTAGAFDTNSTVLGYAYNLTEVTTPASTPLGGSLVMMYRTNVPEHYVFSL